MKRKKRIQEMGVMNGPQVIFFAQNLIRSIPRMFMEIPVFLKLQYFIAQCGPEISGLGVLRTGDVSILDTAQNPAPLKFFVDDIFILEQPVTSISTDLTEAVSSLVAELMDAGRDKDVENLKFRWHSHTDLDIGPHFSEEVDIPTIERLGRTGLVDYMISYVGTHQGQYLARLDLFKPVRLTLEGIPVLVNIPKNKKLMKHCAADIREKVTVMLEDEDKPELIGADEVIVAVDAGMVALPDTQLVVSIGDGRG